MAIVSEDPAGHYNPWGSQGPLGEMCGGRMDTRLGGMPGNNARTKLCLNGVKVCPADEGRYRKVRLKPYWGKPTVRNFRGGRGNGCMDWPLFATKTERSDTMEAGYPKHTAPLLYSTQRVANPRSDWREQVDLFGARIRSADLQSAWALIRSKRGHSPRTR
jgi:hypothetical protein